MLRRARICQIRRPSVCPWRLGIIFYIGWIWNTSNIISPLISLRLLLALTPTLAILSNGSTSKYGGIRVEPGAQKPAISPKRCKTGPRLLWRTNRKSHTRFRSVPKSMTLDDLERRGNVTLAEIKEFHGAKQKNLNEDWHILSAAKCRRMILVSRNKIIRYMRIFAGVPSGGGVKYNKRYAYVKTLKTRTRAEK